MRKRIFSLFLCAVLLLSLLPTAALAEALPEQGQEETVTPVEVPEAPEEEELPEEPELDAAIAAVQAMIDALPTVETVTMDDYDAVQAAYDAYEALTAEQQAQIIGAEAFEALFAWFNEQITATDDTSCIHETYKVGNWGYYHCANEDCDINLNGCVEGIVEGKTVTRCFQTLPEAISYALENYETATVTCLLTDMDISNPLTIPINGKANQTLTLELNGGGQHDVVFSVSGPESFVFNIKNSTNYVADMRTINVESGTVNIYGGGWYDEDVGVVVGSNANVTLHGGNFKAIEVPEGKTVAELLPEGYAFRTRSETEWIVDVQSNTLKLDRTADLYPIPLESATFQADSPTEVRSSSYTTWSVDINYTDNVAAFMRNNSYTEAKWSYTDENGTTTELSGGEISIDEDGHGTAQYTTQFPVGTYTLTCEVSCYGYATEATTATLQVTSTCPHNYINSETGVCSNCKKQFAAVVLDRNDQVVAYYEDIAAANGNMQLGCTLKLLKDVEVDSTLEMKQTYAWLDLNNHALTHKKGQYYTVDLKGTDTSIKGPGSIQNLYATSGSATATLQDGVKVSYATLSMMKLLTVKDAEIENLQVAAADVKVTSESANLGTVTVSKGSFTMSAGSVENLTIKGTGTAELSGGTYASISIDPNATTAKTVGALLADGYAYQTEDVTYYTSDCTLTSLSNVTVLGYVPPHSFTVAGDADNVEYNSVSGTYTINVTYGDEDFDLDKIFSSTGSSVTFELQNPDADDTAVCVVNSESGYVLSIKKAGSATVIATAAADGAHSQATLTIKIQVARAMPDIPENLTVAYGKPLSTVTLPEGWTWVKPEYVVTETPDNETAYLFPANYTPTDGNYEALINYDLSVKVTQGTLNIEIELKINEISYGEPVQFTKSNVPETATVNYYYSPTSTDTWTELPENQKLPAGTYEIKAEVSVENYEKWTGTQMTLTVEKAMLTITGVTAVNRQYQAGNRTVELSGGELVGVLGEDKVGFTLGTGTMDDDTIGEGKPVATNIQLTGDDAGNYTLTQPKGLTVTIFCNHESVDKDYICDNCEQQMVARIGTNYYSTLPLAVEAAVDGDTIEILRDIYVTESVGIAKKVTLTSVDSQNPCQITSNVNEHGYLLSADKNGEVTLTNIIVDGGSERDLTAKKAAIAVNGGKLIVNSGTIVRNNDNTYFNSNNKVAHTIGGGICVISGELVLNSGTITGNHAYTGGGIGLYDGLVTVNSDAVVSNNSNDIKDLEGKLAQTVGGGIGVTGGELVINGGTITGNYAYFGGGIGLYDGSATVKAKSGSITGNKAEIGGGITVWEFVKKDSTTGEILPSLTGTLHIGGGVSVTGNNATYYAGGINCHWGTVYISGHPCLAGNTTDGGADNKKETNSGMYLDGQATSYSPVILEGELTEGAVISFYSWFGTDGTVIGNPGTGYTITETDLSYLSYEDDDYYLALIDGSIVLKSRTAPTGTAPEALELTYTGDEQTLVTAGAYTGGTVWYRMGETGEWAQSLPTATAVGTYPIYWKVVGDAQHTDLKPTLITAKIIPQTISIDGNGNGGANGEGDYSVIIEETNDFIYDGTEKTPSIVILDGNGKTVSADEYEVSYADNIDAGTATIIITDKEGGNYTVNGSTNFQILKADQHPTAADVKAVYGDTDKAITVSNAVGEVTYEVTEGTDVVEVAKNGALTIIKAGSATVSIAAAGNENYNPATITITVTVGKAAQNPTAADVEAVYGDTNKVITVSNAVGDVSYEVTEGTDVVTVDENGNLSFLRAGNAVVTVTAAGDSNHKEGSCTANITVSKLAITVTALDKKAYVYAKAPDLSNPVLDRDYTISGVCSGDTLDSSVTVTLAYEDGLDMKRPGEYDIIPTVTGEDSRYSFICVNGTLNVRRLPVVPSTPSKPDNSHPGFIDVPEGSYFEDAVDWAVDNGITNGVSSNLFAPDGICTRAQAVTFLWRMSGCPTPRSSQMPFVDVVVNSYYYEAVLWAVENGITVGTSATTFSPDENCSRAHIVTFLWRASGKPVVAAANPFADVSGEAYYTDAVLWAVENRITLGTGAATFSPDADCTRAQIVTFIYRAQ